MHDHREPDVAGFFNSATNQESAQVAISVQDAKHSSAARSVPRAADRTPTSKGEFEISHEGNQRPVQFPSIHDLNVNELAKEIYQVEEREEIIRQSIARQQAAINDHDAKNEAWLKFVRYNKEQLEDALMLYGRMKEEIKRVRDRVLECLDDQEGKCGEGEWSYAQLYGYPKGSAGFGTPAGDATNG